MTLWANRNELLTPSVALQLIRVFLNLCDAGLMDWRARGYAHLCKQNQNDLPDRMCGLLALNASLAGG
jgi:hypothetical protein